MDQHTDVKSSEPMAMEVDTLMELEEDDKEDKREETVIGDQENLFFMPLDFE